MVEVWTDGSCIPNPGRGGYAWISKCGREGFGYEEQSTNQRMEIKAAAQAIAAFPPGSSIVVTTDSQFVINGATKWVKGWINNGWRTKEKKPVKNQDLWELLWSAMQTRAVTFVWVRGHDGNEMNERVDALANRWALGTHK